MVTLHFNYAVLFLLNFCVFMNLILYMSIRNSITKLMIIAHMIGFDTEISRITEIYELIFE